MATQNIPQVVPFPKVATGITHTEPARPVEESRPVSAARNKMVRLTPEELLAVLKTARSRSARDWAMVLLAYRHGLRASEVCDLKMADADLKAGSLSIRRLKGSLHRIQTVCRHKGQPVLDEVRALRAWLDECKNMAKSDGSDCLFLPQKGGRLSRVQFFHVFQACAVEARLPAQKAIRTH